jgi:Protein of unknown function (DUF1761)
VNGKRGMAIVLAAVSAFAASSLWYSSILFGRQFFALSGMAAAAQPEAWKVAAELLRNVLLASVISVLFERLPGRRFGDALGFAMILWLGFPFTLLSGSVLWQNVPSELALIHLGDWLVKILLMTLIPWFANRKAEMHVAVVVAGAIQSNSRRER